MTLVIHMPARHHVYIVQGLIRGTFTVLSPAHPLVLVLYERSLATPGLANDRLLQNRPVGMPLGLNHTSKRRIQSYLYSGCPYPQGLAVDIRHLGVRCTPFTSSLGPVQSSKGDSPRLPPTSISRLARERGTIGTAEQVPRTIIK
jgi:hypothetical protein